MREDLTDQTQETIRNELADYLNGTQTLQEFYEWFAPETTDIHLWAPAPVQDIVYSIKLLLAEYSRGHRTEADLKEKLRPFTTPAKTARPRPKKVVARRTPAKPSKVAIKAKVPTAKRKPRAGERNGQSG